MPKRLTEEEAEALRGLEAEIAITSKRFVLGVEAWRYFSNWSSSYGKLHHADGDAHFSLTQQQSSEFAFSYDKKNNPDTFILFAQPNIYNCLKHIGIESVAIKSDGIVVKIKNFEKNDFYIAGLSFKIKTSIALSEKLLSAKESCSKCQLVEISGVYNSSSDKIFWSPTDVHDVIYPLVV